jgi:hypothetical protein
MDWARFTLEALLDIVTGEDSTVALHYLGVAIMLRSFVQGFCYGSCVSITKAGSCAADFKYVGMDRAWLWEHCWASLQVASCCKVSCDGYTRLQRQFTSFGFYGV